MKAITVDSKNAYYSSLDGVLFNKEQTAIVAGPGGISGNITIPDCVKSIGENAFAHCKDLTGVIIPNVVTSIGKEAFYGCSSLASISIPYSVTSIGMGAFANCHSLMVITVDPHNAKHSSLEGLLYDKSQTAILQCPGGKSGCITIPGGVTSICEGAFCGCTGLTSIKIPSGVTSIKTAAFQGCTGLASITIPASVTGIWSAAFAHCTSLTSAHFSGNAPKMGVNVFRHTASDFTVYYLDGKIGFTSPEWNGYKAVNEGASK